MEEVKTISEMAQLGAGVAMGFGAIGAGIGVGLAAKGMVEAVARQPEAAGKAALYFFIGAAMSEACAIYAFVIALNLSGMVG